MHHYEPHRFALFFPTLNEAKFAELKASLEAHGQIVPVVLFEGMILDGRSRYRALAELGIEPRFYSFTGNSDAALKLAASLNAGRLTEAQRAAAAAEMADLKRDAQNKSGQAKR